MSAARDGGLVLAPTISASRKFETFRANYLAMERQAELEFSGLLSEERSWRGRRHEHIDSCEVLLVVSGSGRTEIEEDTYLFGAGDLIVYNDRVVHCETRSPGAEPLVLYYVGVRRVSLEGMEANRLIPDDVSPVLHAGNDFPVLKQLFEFIIGECADQDLGYETAVNSLLQALLVKVVRIANDQYQLLRSGSEGSLGSRIQAYIDKNYMNALGLRDIARHFYVSHYHLEHVFKQYTGDSPINYLIKRRMDAARRLLESTDLPIKAVAARAGYDSAPYFCVAFRKAAGVSPTEYRDAARRPGGRPGPAAGRGDDP